MQLVLLVSLFLCSQCLYGLSFSEAIDKLKSHNSVRILLSHGQSIHDQARMKGSWGDPVLKIAAKNYPIDTLDPSQTPMTGVEFMVSQNIPLTSKYSEQENQFIQLYQARKWQALQQIDILATTLWGQLITQRKLSEEIIILQENMKWISNIIRVSQNLYSTGKQSQQALLELTIRKSEIKSQLATKNFEIQEIQKSIGYLLGDLNNNIDLKTVPWSLLTKRSPANDKNEKVLQANLMAKEYGLSAKKHGRIPDITLSFGYTKRSDIDDNGDFVTITAALPIPSSDLKHYDYKSSIHERNQAQLTLEDYLKKREALLAKAKIADKKNQSELRILNSETISFAENSREVTTKSYQLGEANYIELLQSELKLQKLRTKKVTLVAKLNRTHLEIKALLGEKLYE